MPQVSSPPTTGANPGYRDNALAGLLQVTPKVATEPANTYQMIRRRAPAAGITTKLRNRSFRATGFTAYQKNSATLEKVPQMADDAITRTTQLYDSRREELGLDEVERIRG